MEDFVSKAYSGGFNNSIRHVYGEKASASARQDYHHSMSLFFIYFIKGKARINIEDSIHELNEGEIILLNPSELFFYQVDDGIYHERITLSANVIRMMKYFPCDISGVFSPLYKRKAGEYNVINSERVKEFGLDKLFCELLEIRRENGEAVEPLAICKTIEIVWTINKIIASTPGENNNCTVKDSLVNRVLEYVNSHFADDICIQDIADHFSVHRSYLLHKFKEQMNIPLWDYVIKRRIFKFNSLVKENTALEEAAYQVGFPNYSNFYRLYKKNMGITPLEFKQQLKDVK
jgi:AraC-like DNA-binding protein